MAATRADVCEDGPRLALHHSSGLPTTEVVERRERQEEEVREENDAQRRQTRPPPETRPAPLSEAARAQVEAATVGCVATGAPSLAVMLVADVGIDDAHSPVPTLADALADTAEGGGGGEGARRGGAGGGQEEAAAGGRGREVQGP